MLLRLKWLWVPDSHLKLALVRESVGVVVSQLIVRVLLTSLLQFQRQSTQCLGLVFTATVSQPNGLSTPERIYCQEERWKEGSWHLFLRTVQGHAKFCQWHQDVVTNIPFPHLNINYELHLFHFGGTINVNKCFLFFETGFLCLGIALAIWKLT